MIKVSPILLLLLSCITWLAVGIFLTTFGINLLLCSLQQTQINESFSFITFLTQKIGSRENSFIILISLALFIGYFKGKYVLKKSATKQIKRIYSIKPPITLTHLYTWKYLALIALMMGFGITLRILPIHADVRGFIDIAIGAALINGALHYLPSLKNKPTDA